MHNSTKVKHKMNLRKRSLSAVTAGENNACKDDINDGAPAIKCRDIQATSLSKNNCNNQSNLNNGIRETDFAITSKTDTNQCSSFSTKNLELNHVQDVEIRTDIVNESVVQNGQMCSDDIRNHIDQDDKNHINKLCAANDSHEDGKSPMLNCCEEVLIEIFKNLPISDLVSIMKTCVRFERISRDRLFWRHVSLINCSNTYAELLNALRFCDDTLKALKLRGLDTALPTSKQNDEIIENFTVSLKETIINSPQLTVLELYAIQFDKKLFKVCHLPKTLKCLVLSGCRILDSPNDRRSSWLHGINLYANNLEILRIEYCTWFYPDDLMSISKLRDLHTLSLRGCVRFFDIVAYGSISTLYGFTNLKSLDLRHVPLRDSDLQCFNAVHTLREIKLECYPFIEEEESIYRQLMIQVDDNISLPIQCPPFLPIEYNLESNNSRRVIYVDFRNMLQRNVNSNINNAQPIPNAPPNVYPNPNQLNNYPNNDNINGDNAGNSNNGGDGNAVIHPAYMRQILIREANVTTNRNVITNLGVCSFGSPPQQVHPHRIWISVRQRPRDTLIERFVVRNYKDVTDRFLNHLEQCTPNIVYLDVTGTNCTAQGVEHFRQMKPNCTIISDHC